MDYLFGCVVTNTYGVWGVRQFCQCEYVFFGYVVTDMYGVVARVSFVVGDRWRVRAVLPKRCGVL